VLLVTGFGPFLSVDENPSALLAEKSGFPHHVLEVSFAAVDAFLEQLDSNSFDRLLMIGVARGAEKMRIELVARNLIGETPDVLDVVQGPGPIDPTAPAQLGGTLWRSPSLLNETDHWIPSVDAGTYLCNYIYFRALQAFPNKEIGFLHVPPLAVMPIERQHAILKDVLKELGVLVPA
jgi:pyroglutamyl-peptidase